MAGIAGLGTSFNLPNVVGELYAVTPDDTPFLSAIGGLTGGEETLDTRFAAGGEYDLRDAGQNTRVEGADAPTGEERVRSAGFNVVQIHQEAVEVSYTRQAIRGRMTPISGVNIAGANPVTDEMAWQLDVMLKQIARDVEFSFIRGTFADPGTNATARRTRGLLEAITTNVTDASNAAGATVTLATSAAADDIIDTAAAHGFVAGDEVRFLTLTGGAGLVVGTSYFVVSTSLAAQTFRVAATPGGVPLGFTTDITAGTVVKSAPVSTELIDALMQTAWNQGGFQESETATLMVNAGVKRGLTKAYITDARFRTQDRNVAGVNLQTIETDFGRINIMLNRHVPDDTALVVSLEECAPVHLNIPDKGFMFIEDLAKTGASLRKQVYGEVGLKYGNQRHHAKITGLRSRP